MKKIVALLFCFAFLSTQAFAVMSEEQKVKYLEMKAIKDKQRIEREAKKASEASGTAAPKEPTFWQREAKRAGIGRWNMGQALKNLNPAPFFKEQKERYEERQAAAVK